MSKVNLDAIIPREDFEVADDRGKNMQTKSTLSIEDIKADSFFFSNVRKPDFQRETNEWDSDKISEFLSSFLDGDLIPAIILWRNSSGFIFVIDGSHRLSSLAAWLNNDFGDGIISKKFYDGIIQDEQLEIAERTRNQIRRSVGLYDDYKLALTNPEKVKPEIVARAKNLAALAIQLQWVEGDAHKAESSFFKINQQAAPINKTELILLESRKKPNCIAARAIIRSGKGHKYWSAFSLENQETIQKLSSEINAILFTPRLKTPIKTLDIPIGGKNFSSQTLPLILDFINIVNEVPQDFKNRTVDDLTGEETIKVLKRARKIAYVINSSHASSLGLHPAVYFYSQDGRHKVASFYAVIEFVKYLETTSRLPDFIKIRKNFEEVLLKYDYLVQQINRQYRSALSSYVNIKEFYVDIMDELLKGHDTSLAVTNVVKLKKFDYLKFTKSEESLITSSDFSTERKSAVFIKEALAGATRCKICDGYLHSNSISIDHIERKEDGGTGSIDNGQVTHPYCNTTLKN